jgi:RNA polymerase sigma-B factor
VPKATGRRLPLTAPVAASRGPNRQDRATDEARMRRYGATHDLEDREWLIERYLPLARHVAARYRGGSEPIEDLEQVASLALVKAIDRFDASRGTSFSSYAVPTISGELRRHFRDHTWALRVPRDLQELAVKVGKAEGRLQLELGRAPTAAELADQLDCSVEELLEARDAAGANRMSSLAAPVTSDEDDGASLADMLGTDDERLEHVERTLAVDSALESLDARGREILRLRFQEELTQAAIGERVGLSQMHVSRLIRQALETLRAASRPEDGLRDAA